MSDIIKGLPFYYLLMAIPFAFFVVKSEEEIKTFMRYTYRPPLRPKTILGMLFLVCVFSPYIIPALPFVGAVYSVQLFWKWIWDYSH